MRLEFHLFFTLCALAVLLSGCTVLEATGEAVGVVGKAGWEASKAVGGAVYTGTSMAGQTANQTNKTVTRPSSRAEQAPQAMLSGDKVVIPLIREEKSFYVRVKINDKVWGKFMVDTGASAMQISGAMARKLKVKNELGRTIPVTLAGGAVVPGQLVILKKVQVGDASVENVRAIVLENDNIGLRDGLLGMSFLENFVFQIDVKREELILKKR